MDSEFEELKPTIEEIRYQTKYQQLRNVMFDTTRNIPFELHLHLTIQQAQYDLDTRPHKAFEAKIILEACKQIKKEYQALKLIS